MGCMRVAMKRILALIVSIAALLAPAAPAAHAFAGRDGAIVYRWFQLTEDELQPEPPLLDEQAIRAISPRGGTPRTLRGCTKAAGRPDVGDCSIGYASPAVSPSGRLVAFDAGVSLALMRIDGSGFRLLPARSADDGDPAFSPAGTRLAFSAGQSVSTSAPARGIWTSDLNGARPRRVTARGTAPAWSSRNWIAFLRRDGAYRVRPDGRGLRRIVARTSCTDVAWSPRGTKLALACRSRLLVADGDGRHLRTIRGVGATQVAWSPTGTRLAVSVFDGGLVTLRPDGRGMRMLVPGGFSVNDSFGAGGLDWQPLR
jgi:WD40-like Beta Propeller Repeat